MADIAHGQKSQIQALRENEILRRGQVLTLDAYTAKNEADIEDLFEPELFADLLNQTYSISGTDKLDATKLQDADNTTVRLVKQAEAVFRTYIPASGATFDHFAPASWLIQNPGFLDGSSPLVAKTLDRCEPLIADLNKLLDD